MPQRPARRYLPPLRAAARSPRAPGRSGRRTGSAQPPTFCQRRATWRGSPSRSASAATSSFALAGLCVFALEQVGQGRRLFSENERPVVARRPGELGRARELELSPRVGSVNAHRVAEVAPRPRRGALVARPPPRAPAPRSPAPPPHRTRQPRGRMSARLSKARARSPGSRSPQASSERECTSSASEERPRATPPATERHANAQGERWFAPQHGVDAATRFADSGSGSRATPAGGRSRAEDALLR